MPLQILDHFNVVTSDHEASAQFYADVLGMRIGDRPPFKFPGSWLYVGDQAVLHLVEIAEDKLPSGKGRFNHIALQAEGYADIKTRLAESNIEFDERVLPGEDRGQTQIFFETPDNVTIELIFQPDDVAAG